LGGGLLPMIPPYATVACADTSEWITTQYSNKKEYPQLTNAPNMQYFACYFIPLCMTAVK
jgi:hypothetical protein